jgi:hypothetical protein
MQLLPFDAAVKKYITGYDTLHKIDIDWEEMYEVSILWNKHLNALIKYCVQKRKYFLLRIQKVSFQEKT